MQALLTDIIERDCLKAIPDAKRLRVMGIDAERRLGFHIVTSSRFICSLKVTTHRDQEVGLKLFVKNRPNVTEEYDNMRLLWNSHYARSDIHHIPEPVYLDKANNLLFMRYWPGSGFLYLFYKAALRGSQHAMSSVNDCVRRAADWLVDFQNIYCSTEDRDCPLNDLDFEDQLRMAPHLNTSTRLRIISKMKSLQGCFPKFRETYVHDQYLLRNIIYTTGQICVVDLPNVRTGWPLYDVFTFYTGIERLTQYPLFSRSMCEVAKDTFAKAYFTQRGGNYDAEELKNLWAFFLLGHVQTRYKYKAFRGIRGAANDLFVRRMFKQLARWSRT